MRTISNIQKQKTWRKGIPLGFLFLTVFSAPGGATTVSDVCSIPGNTCSGDMVDINAPTPVDDESVLDFDQKDVWITAGGKLILTPKLVGTAEPGKTPLSCPAKPAVWMAIKARNLTIHDGGEITGSYPGPDIPNGLLNAGTIAIELSGNLTIEAGGKLTSDRHERGNGRSGIIGVEVDGQIDVQANSDGVKRGEITENSNSSGLFAFNKDCGRPQITLLAKGDDVDTHEALRIAGTVEIAELRDNEPGEGPAEDFIGGVVTMVAGVENAFPLSFTPAQHFRMSLPVNRPNPPDDQVIAHITETGLINVNALDHGGGEVHIIACYVYDNGLIQVGGDAHSGTVQGRETFLPTLVEIVAHEEIWIMPDVNHPTWVIPGIGSDVRGGIRADLREGFRQHIGQGITNPTSGLGEGCAFTLQTPPRKNGAVRTTGRGGADVCLVAGRLIEVDSKESTQHAVRARTGSFKGLSSSGQTGGTILAMTTREGGNIRLQHGAFSTNGVNSNADGGLVVVQATDNLTVTLAPPPPANDPDDPTNPNNAICYGNINTNGGGKGPNKGGQIWLEATSGEIKAADGKLCAVPNGKIKKREGIVDLTNNPMSNPPEEDLPPMPGDPQLVRNLPLLLPCVECSCIDTVSLDDATVTITGHNLDQVTQVAFAPTCAPDDQCVVNVPFSQQSQGTIKLPLPGCATTGDHVVVGDPGLDGKLGTSDDASPSISCSRDTFPF